MNLAGAAGSRLQLAACTLVVLFGFAYRLDGYPLLDPDEGRNAEVAREMAERNDYVLPRLNGLPYVDKPVVFFAAEAAVMELLGPTPFAARIPPLAFTLATLVLVWWFGRRLFGPEAGWIAAVATGASPLTLAFARTAIMDSATTLFVTAAVIGFYETIDRRIGGSADRRIAGTPGQPSDDQTIRPSADSWWSAWAWAALALGVLTKGPVALGVPLMVAIPYAAWRKAWRATFDPVGLLLFAALVLPWVRAVAERVPGFLRYVFVTETFERLTTPALQRSGPWWYFLPILLVGALPWSVMALASTRRIGGPADRRIVFLLLWVLVPLIFFSLSQSKRPQYVLPLVPAVALLAAGLWSRRATAAAGATIAALGSLLVAGHSVIPRLFRDATPQVAEAIPQAALALGAICLCSGAAAFYLNERWETGLLALTLPVAGVSAVSGRLMQAIGADRSAAQLAVALAPALGGDTEVVGVRAYPPSLPFYLRRTMVIATDSGRELTSNYLIRNAELWRGASGSPLRPGDWWREAALSCDRPRVFVIRSSDTEARVTLASRLPHLTETGRYAAYGPCGRSDFALQSGILSGHHAGMPFGEAGG